MPYFVRLPSGKYGQFDSATPKFIHTDLSLEDVRERAGDMVAALGSTFHCEKVASDVANDACVDTKYPDAPYCEVAHYGFRRYVGCMYAIKRRYGALAMGQVWDRTKGEALMSVFPPSFWQGEPEWVCVGYVVKKTRYQKQDEWLYLSMSTNGVSWCPGQEEAARFTRVKAHEIVRFATETDRALVDNRTYKVVRLMRRMP